MADNHYPTIDLDFLEKQIIACSKVIPESRIHITGTTTYVMNGNKALYKRYIVLREIEPGQISFENATALALKCNFMGALLRWMEENKGYKDGGYTLGDS